MVPCSGTGRTQSTQPMWRELGRLAGLYVYGQRDRQFARQAALQAFAAFSAWAGDNTESWMSIRNSAVAGRSSSRGKTS